MMQDNFNNQNHLQEEDSIDIKKEAGYYLFFGLILLPLLL
jgi:hypothetical protein